MSAKFDWIVREEAFNFKVIRPSRLSCSLRKNPHTKLVGKNPHRLLMLLTSLFLELDFSNSQKHMDHVNKTSDSYENLFFLSIFLSLLPLFSHGNFST